MTARGSGGLDRDGAPTGAAPKAVGPPAMVADAETSRKAIY